MNQAEREALFELGLHEQPSKVMSLSEAVGTWVKPGSTIHVAYSDARPNAALMEIARQFAGTDPRFTLVTSGLVSVQHALVELGLIEKVITSFAGENYPVARPNRAFQRAVESGTLTVENWSLWTLIARLMAGALGVSYMPVNSLAGSSMALDLPYDVYREIEDPFRDNKKTSVVAALHPDVSIIQGVSADPSGNVVMAAPYGESMWGALSSSLGVIACVERVASIQEIRHHSALVRIPSHKVLAVCEVPFGSHPYGMFNPGFPDVDAYVPDREFLAEVRAASNSAGTFASWISEWILDIGSHDDYLKRLGHRHLASLKSKAHPNQWRADLATLPTREGAACSSNETLVVAASRLIQERAMLMGYQAVLAGVGLANLAAWSAVREMKSNDIEVELMAEIGMFGYEPRPGEAFIFSNRNLHTCKWLTDVSVVLGSLVGGRGSRSIGVIGAAQVDPAFNTNSTYGNDGRFLVGSGGANDIMSSADEVIVTIDLDASRLVGEIPYITGPGTKVGAVVTSGGIFERRSGLVTLTRYMAHMGTDERTAVESIRSQCSWDFLVADDLICEPKPTQDELEIIRMFDPLGDFLGKDPRGLAQTGRPS